MRDPALRSGLFDTIVETVVEDKKKLNFFVAWVIGQVCVVSRVRSVVYQFARSQCTVVTSGLVCYPWDTVRRRMMMQSGRTDTLYKVIYRNLIG